MKVELIAITRCVDGHDVEALIEHAGRICYRSQVPGTPDATAQFIQRRVQEGHESIIEHGSASFEISGISRACSHQIVRHRLCSFSMASQRYIEITDPEYVTPASLAGDTKAAIIYRNSLDLAYWTYKRLLGLGVKKEDARFILPNATATRLILTANFRELLHIFRLRIAPAAQWEIRQVCVQMLEAIYLHAPSVFGDLREQLHEAYPEFFEVSDDCLS